MSETNKPAILLLGSQMAIGGAQFLLLNQADYFSALGYRVTAAFLYDRDGLQATWQAGRNYPIVNLQAMQPGASALRNFFNLLRGMLRLFLLLRRSRIQAIETFTHHSNLIGCPLAWLAGVPVRIASHHGTIERMPRHLLVLHSWVINLGLANKLVAVSWDILRQAADEGVHKDRLVLIPNGVKVPTSDPQAAKHLRDLYVPGADGKFLIAVGRLTYQKAHTYLLRALPEVLKHFPLARLALIGDGVLRGELMAEAARLGISEQVYFLGVRSDVADLMAAADVFVMPSRWEGLSLALLEAMGAKLAILTTRVNGAKEALEDGKCGVIVPTEDVQALSDALIYLLGHPEQRRKLVDAAYQRFIQEYTLEKMTARYLDLLEAREKPLEQRHEGMDQG
jgi:glycosyltransferase involved in cell wall biosynthesis